MLPVALATGEGAREGGRLLGVLPGMSVCENKRKKASVKCECLQGLLSSRGFRSWLNLPKPYIHSLHGDSEQFMLK